MVSQLISYSDSLASQLVSYLVKLVSFHSKVLMILSFFHFYSLVILLVSLFFSCFRYFYVFINFIGDIFKIIVKRYWIALEIALYKFSIIISGASALVRQRSSIAKEIW